MQVGCPLYHNHVIHGFLKSYERTLDVVAANITNLHALYWPNILSLDKVCLRWVERKLATSVK